MCALPPQQQPGWPPVIRSGCSRGSPARPYHAASPPPPRSPSLGGVWLLSLACFPLYSNYYFVAREEALRPRPVHPLSSVVFRECTRASRSSGRGRRHRRAGGDASGCYPAAGAAKAATTVRPSPPRQVKVSAPAPTLAAAPPASLSLVSPASPAARSPPPLLPPPLLRAPQPQAVGRRQDAMAAGGGSTGEENAVVCCWRIVGGAIAAAGTG